jgi:DNA helicase-2/ATP-dependent DNA helicase PcrA
LTFATQEEEVDWIVHKINELVGTEYKDGEQVRRLEYSDIAIQFRSIANGAPPYIDALNEAKIPIVYSGVGGLFETTEVNCVIRILSYISKIDRGVSYDDTFLSDIWNDLPPVFTVPEKHFDSGVKKLEEYARKQRRLSLQGLYGLILELLGVSKPEFHSEENEVLLYNLGRLSTAITDYEGSREYITYNGIKSFIWFIRLHAERSYDSGPTDATAHLIDAVQILTMHGTKGLGFPVVFMPGNHRPKTNNKLIPTWIDTTKVDLSRYASTEQDERRLYYVGLTRAKKYLFVTYSRVKIGNSQTTRAKDLFHELNDDYFITSHTPDPTERKPCTIKGVSEEARFPTSYSEMAYYISCGYDYKMRFIYGFDPGIVQALGFGKQVHNIINLLYEEYENTGTIPSKRKIAEIVEGNFYIRYASSSISDRLKLSAFKSIERYVKMWQEDFSLALKTERPFELEFDNALIAGAIDMIKRESDDGASLEVIDFKTGKPDNELMEKYELQIQLYTIAAKEALGMDIQSAQVHFLDANKNERMQIGTSEHALETAREQISYAIEGITKMEFKRDARNDKKCKACDWKNICPKRNN